MAKALLETAARSASLGPISLNLRFAAPLWKLLLGEPLGLADLEHVDPTEARSLAALGGMRVEGALFETFTWCFTDARRAAAGSADGNGGRRSSASGGGASGRGNGGMECSGIGPGDVNSGAGAMPVRAARPGRVVREPEVPALPTGRLKGRRSAPDAEAPPDGVLVLKPGGAVSALSDANKREYVLLKARRMLVDSIAAQVDAMAAGFYAIVPRPMLERFRFNAAELELLVCGEQVRRGFWLFAWPCDQVACGWLRLHGCGGALVPVCV